MSIDISNAARNESDAEQRLTGKARLEAIKARLYPPENKAERVARALEALARAKIKHDCDLETVRYFAEDADLEDD